MGVSHTRTHHEYLSQLYAFEISPSFRIVAKTGLFCLPWGRLEEGRGNFQVGLNLGGRHSILESFDCPSTSFVSGISEHAADASLAILSYGINDCYPRIAVVEKTELMALLFPQPKDMLLWSTKHERDYAARAEKLILEHKSKPSMAAKTLPIHNNFTPVKKDYDSAAPQIVKDGGRCHVLSSISHRQTPRNLVTNLTYSLESRTTMYEESLSNGANDCHPLFMYNPSLVPLTRVESALRDGLLGMIGI